MAFNVARIASARASLTISLTKSLRVAGPVEFVFCSVLLVAVVWCLLQRHDVARRFTSCHPHVTSDGDTPDRARQSIPVRYVAGDVLRIECTMLVDTSQQPLA